MPPGTAAGEDGSSISVARCLVPGLIVCAREPVISYKEGTAWQLFFTVNNCFKFINLNQAVWWMKRLCYDTLVTYTDGSSPVLMMDTSTTSGTSSGAECFVS